MRIEIDFEAKTIKNLDNVNLKEFMKNIKLWVVEWEDFTLINTVEFKQPYQHPFIERPLIERPSPYTNPYWTVT
jgi:hypothetical protein